MINPKHYKPEEERIMKKLANFLSGGSKNKAEKDAAPKAASNGGTRTESADLSQVISKVKFGRSP